jgi:hypothetical protein
MSACLVDNKTNPNTTMTTNAGLRTQWCHVDEQQEGRGRMCHITAGEYPHPFRSHSTLMLPSSHHASPANSTPKYGRHVDHKPKRDEQHTTLRPNPSPASPTHIRTTT